MPAHVIATPQTAALVLRLQAEFGPLIFHQSGGCCEGTAPMCFRQRDFRVGASDVFLGAIEGSPFYIGAPTFSYFSGSQLIIDVTSGGGDSFSLEAPEGVRFLTRSHLFTDTKIRELDAAGPSRCGPEAFQHFASAAGRTNSGGSS